MAAAGSTLKPFFVSGFSSHTPYEALAARLAESLEKFNLPYRIDAFENLGSWEKNCQQKAVIIERAMLEYRRPIVWLDADSVVRAAPVFFESLDCDLCCHYFRTDALPRELLSGTLYFGYTSHSLSTLRSWIRLNDTNENWDQKNLQTIVDRDPALRVVPLPQEYIQIVGFEAIQGKMDVPFITHFQASRTYRAFINGESPNQKYFFERA